MKIKILLNAISAKKNVGGAFQVSLNFINYSILRKDIEWYYIVSEDIDPFIKKIIKEEFKTHYFVFETQPDFKNTFWKVKKEIAKLESLINPDIVFSLTAPSYFKFKAPEVMRFANAWVTNHNSLAISTLSIKEKIRNYLYCFNQLRLMRKRNYFITQSNAVRKGIIKKVGINPENVRVVPNVLPAHFKTEANLQLNLSNPDNIVYISCIAVPFPHKNLDIIPYVLKELKLKHNITNIKFLLTIPLDHRFLPKFIEELKINDVEDGVQNYGYCTQEELGSLYSVCELCFLPTLLETFSASLLEAMFFNLAIVATDFDFNREVAGDSALYFKPMDVESAASNISLLIKDEEFRNDLKSKMPFHFSRYNSYEKHFDDTLSFLKLCISK